MYHDSLATPGGAATLSGDCERCMFHHCAKALLMKLCKAQACMHDFMVEQRLANIACAKTPVIAVQGLNQSILQTPKAQSPSTLLSCQSMTLVRDPQLCDLQKFNFAQCPRASHDRRLKAQWGRCCRRSPRTSFCFSNHFVVTP